MLKWMRLIAIVNVRTRFRDSRERSSKVNIGQESRHRWKTYGSMISFTTKNSRVVSLSIASKHDPVSDSSSPYVSSV
jgi:hypothetical protein